MAYVIQARQRIDFAGTVRRYLYFQYGGWGHKGRIGWVADSAQARQWTEKSGAYKWLKRNKPAPPDVDGRLLDDLSVREVVDVPAKWPARLKKRKPARSGR